MTYYVTALANDQSKIHIKDMRTSDEITADAITDIWEQEGHIVIRRQEG